MGCTFLSVFNQGEEELLPLEQYFKERIISVRKYNNRGEKIILPVDLGQFQMRD